MNLSRERGGYGYLSVFFFAWVIEILVSIDFSFLFFFAEKFPLIDTTPTWLFLGIF